MSQPSPNLKHRPILIVVSGEPGSGKTTLANALAKELRIAHLERDAFFQGLEFRSQEKVDRPTVGIPRYFTLVNEYLKLGASVIIDGTLYKGISEENILPLAEHAKLINVHCRTHNAADRFYEREVARAGKVPDWLEAHQAKIASIQEQVREPLDIQWKTIEVDTSTKEYIPDVAAIAQKIHTIVTDQS